MLSALHQKIQSKLLQVTKIKANELHHTNELMDYLSTSTNALTLNCLKIGPNIINCESAKEYFTLSESDCIDEKLNQRKQENNEIHLTILNF